MLIPLISLIRTFTNAPIVWIIVPICVRNIPTELPTYIVRLIPLISVHTVTRIYVSLWLLTVRQRMLYQIAISHTLMDRWFKYVILFACADMRVNLWSACNMICWAWRARDKRQTWNYYDKKNEEDWEFGFHSMQVFNIIIF